MNTIWQPIKKLPPQSLESLALTHAHIYLVNLDDIQIDVSVLNAEEQTRASKMRFTQHQQRTQKARAVLRHLLSHYTGIAAVDLEFSSTEYGKLYLANHAVQFNLAHSHEYAVYAFTLDNAIGIDIEEQRSVEFDGIAKRIMSETEYHYWSTRPSDQQTHLFFQIWTRKEALIKATGDGLSGPLKSLSTIDSNGKIASTVNYPDNHQLHLVDLPSLAHVITDPNRTFYAAMASATYLTIDCYSLLPQATFF